MSNPCVTKVNCGCKTTKPIESKKTSDDLQDYWNTIYTLVDYKKNGWYEEKPQKTLSLINKLEIDKSSHILNIGAGTTTLIDELINKKFTNISATDISSKALDLLKERLGNKSKKVKWILDDLTNPKNLKKIKPVNLWIDRAVFHFFTEIKDQNSYIELMNNKVEKEGYAIIATFNTKGATKCSGLPVKRYNELMLKEKLKPNFELIESFNYTYTMPSGDTRPYIYALFKKQ